MQPGVLALRDARSNVLRARNKKSYRARGLVLFPLQRCLWIIRQQHSAVEGNSVAANVNHSITILVSRGLFRRRTRLSSEQRINNWRSCWYRVFRVFRWKPKEKERERERERAQGIESAYYFPTGNKYNLARINNRNRLPNGLFSKCFCSQLIRKKVYSRNGVPGKRVTRTV